MDWSELDGDRLWGFHSLVSAQHWSTLAKWFPFLSTEPLPKISTSFKLQRAQLKILSIYPLKAYHGISLRLLQENPAPRIEGFCLPLFRLLIQRRNEEPLAPLPGRADLIPRWIHQQHLRGACRGRRMGPGCIAAAQPFFDGQGGGGSGSIVGDDITSK